MSDNHLEYSGRMAVKPARTVVIIYVIIKQLVYMLGVEGYYWIPRGIAGIAMLAAIFVISRNKNLTVRTLSYLVPSVMALIEIVLCAIIGGDRLIYIFLMGCSLLSLLFLDSRGLFITMTASALSVAFCAFWLQVTMLGPNYTMTDEVFNFVGLVVINVVIFSIGKHSVGAFERFRKTSQNFNMIMETTPNYMIIINERARVEFISESFARWLGISQREYSNNRPLFDLCRWDELKLQFQVAMESGGYIEKNFEIMIDDKKHWLLMRSSLMGSGSIARVFELADVTPIMEAKLEAEAATRAKSDFLANMSHEIRTPMNAIVGMTELMMTKEMEPEQLSRAVSIKGASMSLLRIINDILDFSKIDAQKMEIINKPFDFVSFINDTVNIVNVKTSSSGVAFTTLVSKDVPPVINGDEIRIKQALINILNNAVKFTKEGCVSLAVTAETLEGNAIKLEFTIKDTGVGIKEEDMGKLFGEFQQLDTRKNRQVVGTGLGLAITRRLIELMGGAISVNSVYKKGSTFSFYIICSDTSPGSIASLPEPESFKVLCYEPNYYSAEALRVMLEDLRVSKVICGGLREFEQKLLAGGFTHVFFDQSAGHIADKFKSEEVIFTLMMEITSTNSDLSLNTIIKPILITNLVRVLRGRTASVESVFQEDDDVIIGELKTFNVSALLVDDNPVNLMVAEGLLRQYGVNVTTAPGGQEAIELAEAREFDIIFMDHMMPEVDGIDATKAIRELDGISANVPIIALSANAITGVEEMFREAGMNDFLPKPILIKNLQRVLIKHLPPDKIEY